MVNSAGAAGAAEGSWRAGPGRSMASVAMPPARTTARCRVRRARRARSRRIRRRGVGWSRIPAGRRRSRGAGSAAVRWPAANRRASRAARAAGRVRERPARLAR